MNRSENTIFNLNTIVDYLEFCSQAVDEFAEDQANVLRGFSAILALNHIPDWLQYKLSDEQRLILGLRETEATPVKEHFESKNAEIQLIRSIANGFKHLRPVHSTQRISGFGQGPFGMGPFGAPYLLIDKGEDFENSERWAAGLSLCKRTLEYWTQTLQPIIEDKK